MRYLSLVFFLINFSLTFAQENEVLTKREEKFLKGIFQEGSKAEAIITSDQDFSFFGSMITGDRIYILKRQDEIIGYLMATRALGRYDYFDYLLAYGPDLTVRGLIITVYRSSHGAAVCQKKWLSQFEGYAGEDLTLGKEIDAVSGATISAASLVKDLKRCYQLMNELKEKGIIQ